MNTTTPLLPDCIAAAGKNHFLKIVPRFFKSISTLMILLFAGILFAFQSTAQTTVTIAAGTTTWTCPVGVFSVDVECWGAGGGGGAATGNPAGGGGGAGGSYSRITSFAVVPGTIYNVSVGTGGTVSSTTAGGQGGFTWFNSAGTVYAVGGAGGALASTNSTSAAGGTATTTGNIGSTIIIGGNGGTGATGATAGGGGGSAGTALPGNPGGATTAGAAVTGGGAGGTGGLTTSTGGAGNPGSVPGGGGGGGRAGSSTDRAGAVGGAGQIKLTYTALTYKSQLIGMSLGSTTWCAGETRNISIQIKNIGTASWTDASGLDFNVGVKWNTNGANWNDYHVRVDAANLVPGATGTYNFTITASNATAGPVYGTVLSAGTNNLIFDVVYEGVAWFGDNGGGTGPGNVKFTSPAQTITALPTITKGANPAVCQGVTTANLTYSATTGTPNQYSINYDAAAELAGFVDVVNATLPASPIPMTVPAAVATGTYNATLTVHNSTTGCSSTAAAIAVTVNGNSTLGFTSAAGTDAQTKCINTAITNITYLVGGSGTGATVTGLPTGVTGAYNSGTKVFTISGTPSVAGFFSYTVTTTGPCGNTSLGGTIDVTAASSISLASAAGTNTQTICTGSSIVDINYTYGGTATGASITAGALPAGVISGDDAGGNFTITGTPTVTGAFSYTVTTSGPCPKSLSGTITVNANSTLSFTSAAGIDAQTKCISTAITNITYLVGGGGTGASATGLPTGVTGAYNSGTKVFTISGTPSVAGTFNYTVNTAGPCVNPSLGGTITVVANATISLTSGAGTNIQTKCANSAITTITYAIGGTGTGAFVTGLPLGVTGSYSAAVFTISGAASAAVSGVFNYTVTTSGPCVNPNLTGTLTINAIPTTTGVTVCQGGSGSLTSSFACASGGTVNTAATNATTGANVTGIGNTAWTNPGNVVSDNNSYATVALTSATAVSNYLRATGYSFAIPVNATIGGIRLTMGRFSSNVAGSIRFRDNEVKLVKAGTIVGTNKANAGVDWPSAEAAITYGTATDLWGTTWTAADINNANFGAVLSGLNATGVGNTYTGSVDYMQITVTYTVPGSINWYTVSSGGTLLGSGSPFNPVGVAGSTLANTNTAGTTTFYAECSSVAGCRTPTDFVINALPTVSITGSNSICLDGSTTLSPTSGGTWVSNSAAATVDNSGVVTPVSAGAATFTFTDGTTGCQKTTAAVTINANSTISLSSAAATTSQTKCINTAITNINYAIGDGGTGATVTGLPAGVNGSFSAGVFTISGAPAVAGSFNYTVTTTGPCVNNSLSGTMQINDNATISLSSGAGSNIQTVCINNLVSDVTYAIGGSGTGATVTGLPTGVTGSYSTGVFTISGTPSASGTFNYTVTTTGPCVNPSLGGTIRVNANSTISLSSAAATAAQTKCINTAITNITYAIGGGGTGASVIGLPAGITGSYNAAVFTISGASTVAGTFNYTVTTTGPCVNNSLAGTININPDATISLTSAPGTNTQSVCNNTAIVAISYTIGGGAAGAGVTGLPAGVTGLFNAGVITISGTPTVAGTFNYTVTTTGTCAQTSANGSITVNAPPVATYTHTNVSACGAFPDGTISIAASGGTAPYSYSWTGVTGSGNPATTQYPSPGNVSSVSGLKIGFYNVTITDAVGCQVSLNNIHIQYAFAAYITNNGSISSACGNTGSIVLYANAGVQPYSFSLDGTNFSSNNTFTNLAAGTYTAYVKDGAGCVITKTIQVNAAAPIVVNPFVRGASSCSPDGSIEIYRTGGIPPYSYSLDGINYQVSNKYLNLAAGTYTTYVKDSKGCVGSQTAIVTQGTALTVNVTKTNTSTCMNDGSIQVIPSGGIAPYTYSKNGGPYQSGNSFGGLAAGNYAISVKDFKGCLGAINVTINLNQIVVTANIVNASSCASSNGSVQLFRTGGVGPYTYSLDGNTYQNGTTFTNLAPGEYDAFVKDSKTCIGYLFGIVVGPNCAPPVAGGGTNTKMATGKTATAEVLKISAASVLRISAYPNPSAASFMLSLEGSSKEKVTVIVTDMVGRKVYQAAGNLKQQYKFGNDLMPGIYMLQVLQGTEKQSLKLIKE